MNQFIAQFMVVGGAIVLLCNLISYFIKMLKPATDLKKMAENNKQDIKELREEHDREIRELRDSQKEDFEHLRQCHENTLLQIQKTNEIVEAQSHLMVTMINHMIDGNNVEHMKKTRDNMLKLL